MPGIELNLLRDAGPGHISALESVFLGAPSYCLLTEQRLPCADDASEALTAIPPGCRPEQKHFFGIYLEHEMIGCIDMIRGWPATSDAHIGLLLLKETHQGHGYGDKALETLESYVREWSEVSELRIAVVEVNQRAFSFWRRAGFRETGQRVKSPLFVSDLIIMKKRLAAADESATGR